MQKSPLSSCLKKALLTGLGLALLSLPASAGQTKSQTKSAAGLSFKLTRPDPLPMGDQKLFLKVSRGGSLLKGVKLTAQASMGDGMKSPVKVTAKANGELELKTHFSMDGEWTLKLQQTAPVKANLSFELMVSGGDHGHKM